MQTLSNLLSGNKTLEIVAAALAFFVAAVLILLVFRLAFGRRLRMPGGRSRQMRLGIVDAFDLDRQRQLVIVRRDNVEHLVMIGGPNDILIESQIIRTEARSRDKDLRGEPNYVQGPAQKQHAEPKMMPEPQPVGTLEDYSTQNLPPPRERERGVQPPRRGAPSSKMPSVHEMPPGQPEFSGRPERMRQGQQPPPPPPGQDAPAYMRWPSRQAAAPQPVKPQQPPKQRVPGNQPAPAPRSKVPQPETEEAWPPAPSVEGLESLEEEMAKLLGRGPKS